MQGITFLPPRQYMDKYQLDAKGLTPVANDEVKQKLGFAEARRAVPESALR
ncbi:MAG: hypothetical protein HYZ72_19750 [Deltaproteobacteria bacterium]|nr:hypothetical protein [Deltaproteobacteria bacterium]